LKKQTLILGNGPCAVAVAENLLTVGSKIIIATKDDVGGFIGYADSEDLQILTETRLVSCQGSVGNFRIEATQNNKSVTIDAGRIIIAEEDQRTSNFSLYGLKASSNVIPLSRMKILLNDTLPEKSVLSEIKKVIFLTGIVKESTPVIANEVMESSLLLQKEFNIQTYILTKNLKVAGDGLESLYRETKNAGTIYIKFTDSLPGIYQEEDTVRIEFVDEITSRNFRLTPDMTVVDETIVASPYLTDLTKIFHIEADADGFVQADNVHRYPVLTNRKGIMVTGPSRGILTDDDQRIDAENAALAVTGLAEEEMETKLEKAEIHSEKCIQCLNCYHLCPHHAITLNERVEVELDACEGCGICTANCLGGAVRIKNLNLQAISHQIKTGDIAQAEQTFTPLLVAFCCSRSAVQARELALCMGHELPLGLKVIQVPCAGAISYDHIFAVLKNGADGIMLLTCHKGNCYSERGNIFAGQVVKLIKGIFSIIGFEKERLSIQTLASNMGTEFSWITNRFEKMIAALGPSRLMKNQWPENQRRPNMKGNTG